VVEAVSESPDGVAGDHGGPPRGASALTLGLRLLGFGPLLILAALVA
jgi:hypothetical protein